jgi:hypothetical protein
MKKKIINGIMMVALVAATSTSFVSCKDTNEDVRIEQAAEIADLQDRLDDLNDKYGDLDGRVSALKTKVGEIDGKVGENATAITAIEEEITQLELWLSEAFAKLVTGVEISGTYNNMLGSINYPGYEPKMLIFNYGVATAAGTFPSSDLYEGTKLEWVANDFIGADKYNAGFAGNLYATVNRYLDLPLMSKDQWEKSEAELKAPFYDFDLVKTNGEKVENLVILNTNFEGGPTEDVLQWGWTRADNNVFKFGVAYTGTDVKEFEGAKIDLKDLKEDIKAIWRDRNRQTGTSKEALARLFADLYYKYATRDTNMKKYAFKISWADNSAYKYERDDDNTDFDDIVPNEGDGVAHMATSEAELVFAAVKPLGFTSGDALAEKVNSLTKSTNGLIEKFEPAIDRIMKRVQDQLKLDSLYLDESVFDKIKMNDDGKYIMEIPNGTYLGQVRNYDSTWMPYYVQSSGIQIEIDDLVAPMVQAFGKVNDVIDNIKNMLGKVNGKNIGDFLEKFTNKANKLFANHADQILRPVLLAIDENGDVNRVSGIQARPYEATGEITLKPTTYSAEFIAPCYAKFVGCKDIDAENFNQIIRRGDQELKFTPEVGKTYEIVYEAVDFFGNKFSQKYYILGVAKVK